MRNKILYLFVLILIGYSSLLQVNGQALKVPANFPKYTVVSNNSPAEGYYFTVPTVTNMGPGYMIILDNYGTPIYYRYFGTFIGSFSVQPSGMLSFRHRNPTLLHHFLMDSTYTIVDTIETVNCKLDAHDIIAMTNGHYLIFGLETRIVDMSAIVPGGKPSASVIECVIQELDENENLVFEWKSTGKFDLTDSYYDLTASSIDYIHPNSLELDIDGNILLQSRFLDELTKISRQTGDIIWRMGGKRNQFTFTDPSSRFSWAHDARRLPNGNMTMFDNGVMRDEKYTRAVEYEVDEVNKIMNLVWSYDAGKKVYSPTTGSMRKLSNGNVVVGYGFDVSKPALLELNPDSSVAFRLDFPQGAGSYRSLKFPWRTNLFEPITYSVEFAEWDGYTAASYMLPVKNNSSSAITLTSYSTRTTAFTIEENFPIVIPANGSIILTIDYYPEDSNTGFIKDVLTINSDINSETLVQRIAQQIWLSGKKVDFAAPVANISLAGEVNVPRDTVIYVNFNEPVRWANNTEFNYKNVDSLIILKLNNASGDNIPFNAVISTDKNKITVKPKSLLPHTQKFYLAVKNSFEDYTNNSGTSIESTFETVDLTAPLGVITPSTGAINIDPTSPITIQYNEPVRNIDNSELTSVNLASLITLKATDINGTDVSFSAAINSGKTVITITPGSVLSPNSVYYVAIGDVVEDNSNNKAAAINSSFTTGNTTGAADELPVNRIQVYPNPSSGIFRVQKIGEKTTRLRITDTNGKVVYDISIRGVTTHQIDLTDFPEGLYILNIEVEGYPSGQIFKLLKQHE